MILMQYIKRATKQNNMHTNMQQIRKLHKETDPLP